MSDVGYRISDENQGRCDTDKRKRRFDAISLFDTSPLFYANLFEGEKECWISISESRSTRY